VTILSTSVCVYEHMQVSHMNTRL